MSAPYGTRRNSAIQASPLSATAPLPIASTSPYSPGQAHLQLGASLSSSVGKHKRPSTINKTRRLSTSHQLRPPGLLSQSVPVTDLDEHAHHHALHHAADGQLPRKSRKEKGQTYECEKCSKVYRHSTCLTKHRWEHTEHWKEASKLLLSKHQQVQLLEGAAILAAASAGTSLPDEKSFWPAAVSPPTSGLLGSAEFAMQSLGSFGSPRFAPSSLLSDAGDFDRSELDEDDEDDEDDGGSSPPPRAGSNDDEDAQMMEDGMFDLDLGGSGELPPASPLAAPDARLAAVSGTSPLLNGSSNASSIYSSSPSHSRPGIMRSNDSGFGSIPRTSSALKGPPTTAATLAAVAQSQLAAGTNALGIAGASAPTSLLASEPAHAVRGFVVPGEQQRQ